MRSTTYRSIKVHLKLQCSQFLGQVQFCAVGNQELVRRYGCVRSLQGYQDGHIVVPLPSIIAVDIMHCNLWQLVLVQLPLYAEHHNNGRAMCFTFDAIRKMIRWWWSCHYIF
jgi:hypothetical protein